MSDNTTSTQGALAQFETPKGIYHACEQVRDAGFQDWDAHTPFPIHGLEKAMGLSRSKVGFVVAAFAVVGLSIALLMQWWMSAVDYPVIIAGKPYASWPAFVPITFELTVLFSAFGAFLGMLGINQLPKHYHWVFHSERFEAASDDKFFVSIEASDAKFNAEETVTFLRSLGASHVELVEG